MPGGYPPVTPNDPLEKRRVPCMIAFLYPFRIVNNPESPAWNVTLEPQCMGLFRVARNSGGSRRGLPAPYHMVVSRDGGVALPPLPQLRSDLESVEFFNRCLAAMLLGGVYCEAIGLDGLDFGCILNWSYVRVNTGAQAVPNRFHQLLRLRHASPLEAIALLKPRIVTLADLSSALAAGRAILDAVPQLSGEFLLKGVTGIARHDWGSSLANLWIGIEQITSNLWKRHVVAPAKAQNPIAGRAEQLSDTRTWTIAVRHELLHQIGLLPRVTLSNLAEACKARNELAHSGKHPSSTAAQAAYAAATGLLQVAVGSLPIPLLSLNLANHALSDPFAPREPSEIHPSHWMEILKLPGEAELERLEAEFRVESQGSK
jgi:hypothetical protein